MASLTGKQRRHLRALGHKLEAVVQVGKQGVSDSVVAAIDQALTRHELIKIRCTAECPLGRAEAGAALAAATSSEVAQALGRTLLLYRENPDTQQIRLP